ncbi:MAG: S-layer homology domain-containing protein, partial [Chloroflexi bacterium]|nr:S-layer homology domain-containing protein [Chloroflexota bacterium]
MSKAKAIAAGAMVIVATAAPAFAQGKQFPDVPPDHWAAQAVKALADQGIVIGYPDGTYGGPKAMTRYEFAEAISRLLPLITQQIQAAVANMKPGDNLVTRDQLNQILQGYVTTDALQQALQPYARLDQVYTREQADQRFALKSDITAIQNVLDQYGRELTSLGTDVNTLKQQYAALNARVTELERFKVYGSGMVAWKTSEQYTGINRGQAAAGVDRDGALLDNGSFINPAVPGAAVNPGTGKRGFFSDASTFFDTQVGMQYSSDNWRAVAEFILGNYWGAWHEQQAFNAGFAD